MASEASYVYILSGQKFIEKAKNSQFGEFWKTEACGQTVLPDRSTLLLQKLLQTAKIENLLMRHFWWFLNTVQVDFLAINTI